MDTTNLGYIIAVAVGIQRFVEFVKPRVKTFNFSERGEKAVLILIATILGVFVSASANLNLFAGTPRMPEVAGIILTGVLASFGSDLTNAFIDAVYGWKNGVVEGKARKAA